MKNEKVVKITNESITNLSDAYIKSNDNGDLINKFIGIFNKNKQQIIIKHIKNIDSNLDKKINLIQRVILNGIITTLVLKYKNDNEDVLINNVLYQCNSLYNDDIWLNSMKETVIPFLIDNKII